LAHKYSVTGEWWAPASEEKVDRQGMISLVSGSRGNLLEVRRSSRSMVCARGVCAAVASIINCVDGLSNVGSSLPLLELFTSRVDPRRQKNVKIRPPKLALAAWFRSSKIPASNRNRPTTINFFCIKN